MDEIRTKPARRPVIRIVRWRVARVAEAGYTFAVTTAPPGIAAKSRSGARALVTPLVASIALHALPLVVVLAQRFHLPVSPIPIEVRTSRRVTTPRPPPPPPPQIPVVSDAAKTQRGPGAAAKKHVPKRPVLPPPPPPPPATADLRPFAPGDAKLVLLLRTDRLRASPHHANVEFLLESFPDYRTLFSGSGLTPLADLDALLIATPNAFDASATFLAARHASDGRVRAALERRVLPAWDPRTFRYPEPTLSILARPTLQPPQPPQPTQGLGDGAVPIEDARALEARWLDSLRRFERLADEPGAPAVLLAVEDFDRIAHLQGDLPTPLSLAAAITAEPSPAVRVRLVFEDATRAQAFAARWPEVLRRFHEAADMLALGPLLDGLVVKEEVESVEIAGRLPERQVRIALSLSRLFLSQNTLTSTVIPPAPPSETAVKPSPPVPAVRPPPTGIIDGGPPPSPPRDAAVSRD